MEHTAILLILASLAAAADDDLIARARRLCEREGVRLVVTEDMPAEQTARFVINHDRIDLNPANLYWHSRAAREQMRRTGQVSTRHPDHIIMHELAHAKLCRHLGADRYFRLCQVPLGIDPTRAASAVSGHAAGDPLEFAAEVYAGVWCGVRYPPDVMAYYESLWRRE